jgi:hypothetical protein
VKSLRVLAAAIGALVAGTARAETAFLEEVGDRLRFGTRDRTFEARLSGLFDLEAYRLDEHPPGLVFGGSSDFVNPRLWLFLDARFGDRLSSFVEVRADRGFDPRSDSASVRVDEYSLRYTAIRDPLVDVEIGKFATVFGNWVDRHDSWENPLINAPLPYENVTIVSDRRAPATADEFLGRRNVHDKKREWLPIVWGPSYTSGAAALGRASDLEYAVELKNASLASRPSEWDFRHHGWDHPTVTGRLGWHPDAAWRIGASASTGSYLAPAARTTLAAGKHVGDFDHTVFGADLAYAWRHLQIWAEFFASRFEVPNVGDADSLAYYVEAKYKLTPVWFASLRWNEQLFAKVENSRGRETSWDRDAWRVDTALGQRYGRHLQAKLQYSLGRQSGRLQEGEQLVAAQMTVKF